MHAAPIRSTQRGMIRTALSAVVLSDRSAVGMAMVRCSEAPDTAPNTVLETLPLAPPLIASVLIASDCPVLIATDCPVLIASDCPVLIASDCPVLIAVECPV